MLASVRWSAVLWGVGLGALGLGLAALILWLILSAIGVDDPAGAAVTFGTLAGFAVGGLVAGRRAPTSEFFHGALAALGIALAVVVTSIRGGSPAPTPQVLLLAALAIVIGGFAGTR
jgi:putative membrane protein (TIGR04086 family)